MNGEFLLGPADKEQLRLQLWRVAEYCGVQILTYAILDNHFHVLVHVPEATEISDDEMIRRYSALYAHGSAFRATRLDVIRGWLMRGEDAWGKWRRRHLAMMGDISSYMRLVKQRYSVSHNARHARFGTLWAERFKSELVEEGRAVEICAAYIDLNPVRANIVKDPCDYPHCGYAEAVAGNIAARKGLARITRLDWKSAIRDYRLLLFGRGTSPKENAASIPAEELRNVIRQGGAVPLCVALRCRLRFLTQGAIFGTKAFISEIGERVYRKQGTPRIARPQPLPFGISGWDALHTFRNSQI